MSEIKYETAKGLWAHWHRTYLNNEMNVATENKPHDC